MIRVLVRRKNDQVVQIEVSGHSGSAEKGKDLICAGVSSIMFGLANALDQMSPGSTETIEENRIVLSGDPEDPVAATILNTGLIQLETIRESSKAFVEIRKSEV